MPAAAPAEPPPEEALALGTVIDGEYRIEGMLGAGGMGVVYRARDLRLDRAVAVKVHREKGHAHERLAREATALARLAHPNVVGVFRVGRHEGRVYVAMELIEGGTLRRKGEALRPWRDTVRLYCAAGDGLAAAHAAGLVHRDFKPDNVLLGADGRPRVADFGLARAAGERGGTVEPSSIATAETVDTSQPPESAMSATAAGDEDDDAGSAADDAGGAAYLRGVSDVRTPLDARLTVTGAWVGTPAYMAPEQIDGREVDARSDQFSFAVAVWESLHGKRPFAGDTTLALRAAIARQALVPGARNDVPGWVDDVLRRALREDPDERWPSMTAILAALRHDPRARRRQVAVAAGALALAAGTAAIAWQVRGGGGAPGPRCDGGAAEIAAVWNAGTAGDVRARLTATALPYAPDVAARVTRSLDAYGAALAGGQDHACRARADGTWSAALADRAVVCLARRRRALTEAVGLLRTLDAAQLDDAQKLSDRLPPVAECLDPAAVEGQELPPSDPAQAAVYDQAVGAIARAAALNDLYDPRGREVADEAVALAARVGRPALIVEAANARADAAYTAGDDDATARLEQVFFDARAAGHEILANGAATRLVHAKMNEGKDDEARSWIRHATAGTAARPRPRERALIAYAAAVLDEREGKLDRAIAHLESARRAIVDGDGDESVLPDLLDLESGLLGAIGQHERSIAAGRQAVAHSEAYFGANHPALVGRLTNLALSLSETGKHDEAVALMKRAITVCETGARCRRNMPTHLMNLGSVQTNASLYVESLATLARADEGLRAQGERGIPDRALVAAARGLSLDGLGRTDEALAALREAVVLVEESSGPEHPDTARILNDLGAALNNAGRFAESVPILERSLAIWAKVAPGEGHVAMPTLGLGIAQLGLGRARDAVATLTRAVTLLESGGFTDRLPLAHLRLAQAQWATGARDAARATTAKLPPVVPPSLAAEVAAWRTQVGVASGTPPLDGGAAP